LTVTGTATRFSPDTATADRPSVTAVTVSFGSGDCVVCAAWGDAVAAGAATSIAVIPASATIPARNRPTLVFIFAGWHGAAAIAQRLSAVNAITECERNYRAFTATFSGVDASRVLRASASTGSRGR
jgi:hypothetical protein